MNMFDIALLLVSLAAIFFVFQVLALIRGASFLPTGSRTVERMIDMANIQPGEKTVDLGSGDGRIVIAMAVAGAEAHGYEINPLLVLWSRYRIRRAGMTQRASVHWRSFWKEDLSSFNVVVIFGMFHIMGQLERKLTAELQPRSRVVVNTFHFPNWPHSKKRVAFVCTGNRPLRPTPNSLREARIMIAAAGRGGVKKLVTSKAKTLRAADTDRTQIPEQDVSGSSAVSRFKR